MPVLNTLLVADDDETLLQSIGRFFSESGSFEVTAVHSVTEVPDIMVTARFDAVVLGFDLRQSTDAMEMIRSRGDMTHVILFSREEGEEAAIKALQSGASFWLAKGNNPESQFGTLSLVVEELVRREDEVRALRESEARYRDLFENAPDMYLSVDASTGFLADCNNAAVLQTGYSKEEIIGRHVLSLYHPDSVDAARKAFQQFKTTGMVRNTELQVQRKDGSTLDVLLNATAVRDQQGKVLYSRSVWSDITMYRQVQKELRESGERFRLLYEAAPLGYQSLDSDGRIIVINKAWLDTLGYSRKEVIGHWFGEFLEHGDREKFTEIFPEYIEKGALHGIEFSMVKKDGSRIIVSFEGNVGHDREGNFLQTHSILSNITDRKKSERELRESGERYRLLLQNINDAVFVFLPDDSSVDRIIEVNDRGCQMLGYSMDNLNGIEVPAICCGHDAEGWDAIRKLIIRDGHAVFQTVVTKRDGHDIPVDVSARMVSLHGSPVILAVVRDISERKRADETLALAGKKLALLSGITRHDILNQLGLLDGYLSLAEKSLHDPLNFDRFMEKVHMAVQAIQHQITFTRLYQELGMKAPDWVSVNDCIEQARAVLPAGTIRIEALSDRLEVYADPLFEKIFSNLLDNALRYGGESMTTIRFSVIPKNTQLVIVCEDNGAGMTAEEKEHLFERGYGKHTGLGIFLSREILSITGMTIEETSTPGHGARFEITVPAGGFRYTG